MEIWRGSEDEGDEEEEEKEECREWMARRNNTMVCVGLCVCAALLLLWARSAATPQLRTWTERRPGNLYEEIICSLSFTLQHK